MPTANNQLTYNEVHVLLHHMKIELKLKPASLPAQVNVQCVGGIQLQKVQNTMHIVNLITVCF